MAYWRQKLARSVLVTTFLLGLAPAGAEARPADYHGPGEAVAQPAETETDSAHSGTSKVLRLPDFDAAQTRCLSLAIYYEARSEPEEGQFAVGRVILNRAASRYYPDTICEVVYQNAAKRNRCQFSFACDGKPDKPGNLPAWQAAVRMAERLMCREICGGLAISADLIRSTHYHATYVRPSWSKKLRRTGQIGRHIFYFASRR